MSSFNNKNNVDTNKEVINTKNLSVYYNSTIALKNISFKSYGGEITGILGPNGAGKSTLIKAIMGLIDRNNFKGSIKVFGRDISRCRSKIAYVPQQNDIDLNFPITVEETVMMGRYPYLSRLKKPGKHDIEKVHQSMKEVGVDDKKHRQIGELSGGERQRTFLARALAQNAELFFLDEPFSAIDFTSEEIIGNLLKILAAQGKAIFVVHHDLKKAAKFFDSVILLNGSLVASGRTEHVMQPHIIEKAYRDQTIFFHNNEEKQEENYLVTSK